MANVTDLVVESVKFLKKIDTSNPAFAGRLYSSVVNEFTVEFSQLDIHDDEIFVEKVSVEGDEVLDLTYYQECTIAKALGAFMKA